MHFNSLLKCKKQSVACDPTAAYRNRASEVVVLRRRDEVRLWCREQALRAHNYLFIGGVLMLVFTH